MISIVLLTDLFNKSYFDLSYPNLLNKCVEVYSSYSISPMNYQQIHTLLILPQIPRKQRTIRIPVQVMGQMMLLCALNQMLSPLMWICALRSR